MTIQSISHPKLRLEILSPEDVRRIHTATLDLIENVGVRMPSARAQEIVASHGGTVERATNIVRIPGAVVEQALSKAPPAYTLAARDTSLDLPMDGQHCHLGTDGCGVEVLDPATGQRHRSTLQDVQDAARVADYLDAIAFHWTPISAQDRPPESRSLHELLAIWSVSHKHVQTESIVTEREMRVAVEIAAALAGGRDALRRRPILSIMQCTLPPLAQDGGSLEAGLVAAEAGLPGFMTMTLAPRPGRQHWLERYGWNADYQRLALMQWPIRRAGVHAAAQTSMDLRSGAYTGGGPEDYLFGAATNLLADFYNVPLSMGAFATGAKEPGWQSAVDNSLSSFMAVATWSDMLLGAGLLHGSRILSSEMMLLDAEIWSILCAMTRGITVDDETLALDAIREVGPGGNFLAHRHTKKHMRELWRPTYFDRRPFSEWEKSRDGAVSWANAKARELLATYRPERLTPAETAELGQLIASLERT
jgi:trimethylamine--corrinoid protein Co-methyltransferase